MLLNTRTASGKRGYSDGYAAGTKDVLRSIEELATFYYTREQEQRTVIQSQVRVNDYLGAYTAAEEANRSMLVATALDKVSQKHTRLVAQVLLTLGKMS